MNWATNWLSQNVLELLSATKNQHPTSHQINSRNCGNDSFDFDGEFLSILFHNQTDFDSSKELARGCGSGAWFRIKKNVNIQRTIGEKNQMTEEQ